MSDEATPDAGAPIDWARTLVQEQAWVLHMRTGTVGRVARFYDGEGHVYEPRVEPAPAFEPRTSPAIELEEGHTFHATGADQFIRLSPAHARFYTATVDGLRQWTFELAKFAASGGIPQSLFETLVGSAMRGQLRTLGRRGETPTEKPPALGDVPA